MFDRSKLTDMLSLLCLCCLAVRLLREELQLLQEPGSYVGEVVKVMGKTKVLVKVQPEGKYGAFAPPIFSRAWKPYSVRC